MRFPLADSLARLPLPATAQWPQGLWSAPVFAHGSMQLKCFSPRGTDHQAPHAQDELYVVIRGCADFIVEGQRMTAEPGDALFVPARAAHHFEHMRNEFTVWVVFWGPAGGETDGGGMPRRETPATAA